MGRVFQPGWVIYATIHTQPPRRRGLSLATVEVQVAVDIGSVTTSQQL